MEKVENWINFDLRWISDMITTLRAFATGVRELKTQNFAPLRSYLAFLDLLFRSFEHFWLPFGLFWQSWELNEHTLKINFVFVYWSLENL